MVFLALPCLHELEPSNSLKEVEPGRDELEQFSQFGRGPPGTEAHICQPGELMLQ